jgi:hypothetical protein
MRKSRLTLFKSTSMLISILGIIMVATTVIVVAYIGLSMLSFNLSKNMQSGTQYDQLASLRANWTSLNDDFQAEKTVVMSSGSQEQKEKYVDAELSIVEASSAIDDVESGLTTGKSSEEVDKRIKIAKEALAKAQKVVNAL